MPTTAANNSVSADSGKSEKGDAGMTENELIMNKEIQSRIYAIRGVQVMLDEDLAFLYGVDTKVFNQAVKRNSERFPEEFMFQITDEEFDRLRSRIVTLNSGRGKHRKYLPLELDVKKYNEQFPKTEVKEFANSHDSFLITDESIVYHLGASLKDLGKKWFAFSKMEIGAARMLARLEAVK